MSMPRAGGRPRERGVVLVAALWISVLLAIIASAALSGSTADRRIAANLHERARARALADAGVNQALYALLVPEAAPSWPLDGSAVTMEIEGQAVRVAIRDEVGRIDLNAAPEELLQALFRSLGLPAREAGRIADSVADWRDRDGLRRLNGAEAGDYVAAGLPRRPADGPFGEVEELALVLGVTPELAARARPALTVLSGRPAVDPRTAPPEVLRALAALSGREPDPVPVLTLSGLGPADGRAFTLRAEAETRAGARFLRTAAVRLTGDPLRPWWILDWREGE